MERKGIMKKKMISVFLRFQRIEVQVVYHIELHVAVDSYPERFLKSTVFYFLRNTKGENYYNNAR